MRISDLFTIMSIVRPKYNLSEINKKKSYPFGRQLNEIRLRASKPFRSHIKYDNNKIDKHTI